MREGPVSELVTKDARVDKAISWLLTTIVGIAMVLGTSSIRDLRDEVSELKKEIAVLQVERHAIEDLKDEQREIKKRLRAVEQRKAGAK